MKGMATVRLLRQLERHTGRRIHELFDLIGAGRRAGGPAKRRRHPYVNNLDFSTVVRAEAKPALDFVACLPASCFPR